MKSKYCFKKSDSMHLKGIFYPSFYSYPIFLTILIEYFNGMRIWIRILKLKIKALWSSYNMGLTEPILVARKPRWNSFLLHVEYYLHLGSKLKALPEPIPKDINSIRATRKNREDDKLVCRGHIMNTLSDWLYDSLSFSLFDHLFFLFLTLPSSLSLSCFLFFSFYI